MDIRGIQTPTGQDFVNFVEQVAKQPTQLPMVLAEKQL